MNPYEILGVKRNASQDEIRKAYINLMERYKPGEYLGDEHFARAQLKKIFSAYEMLSDKQAKYEYDIKNEKHILSHLSSSDLYKDYYRRKGTSSIYNDLDNNMNISQKKYNNLIDHSLNSVDEDYSDGDAISSGFKLSIQHFFVLLIIFAFLAPIFHLFNMIYSIIDYFIKLFN